jgi:hypothetical protein
LYNKEKDKTSPASAELINKYFSDMNFVFRKMSDITFNDEMLDEEMIRQILILLEETIISSKNIQSKILVRLGFS